jgi:Uma2 family endonuclease
MIGDPARSAATRRCILLDDHRMNPRVLMSVEEYLHTDFDGADREYLDGEVVERNMGELPHAQIQAQLMFKLGALGDRLRLRVLPEIRIQISQTRFRVADIAVWRPGDIGTRIPTVPPFLVVEILSAEDRVVRLQPKIQEYLAHGVEWVWVIDPDERRALSYWPANPGGTLVNELRTDNPSIVISLDEVLAALG